MNAGITLCFDEFCSWLCEKENQVVGVPGIGYCDPLAEWMSQRMGRVYGVEGSVYGPISLDDWLWWRLPVWGQLFFNFTERYMFARPITGKEAFDALVEIERQHGVIPL